MSFRPFIVLSVGLVVVACGGEDPPAGPAETPPAPCPSGRGPAMVRIPMSEGRSACIDSTEVTREQYAAFLADSNAHGAGSRLESCGIAPYKDEPDAACLAEPVVCKGDCARHPQVCVSHCNAQAFCKWAGKSLCATLPGVPPTVKTMVDARVMPWLSACGGGSEATGAVVRDYPYGDTFDATKCNTDSRPGTGCKVSPSTCGTVPVGSLPGCRGDGVYAGIFDLSGNVQEWMGLTEENARAVVPGAESVGGSFQKAVFDASRDFSCLGAGGRGGTMQLTRADVGFRCCAE